MSTNPFQKVAGAKGRVNSEYFRAGRYLFYIRKFSWMKSRKDENLVLFECLTVQVLDPSAAAADPKGPHRVGDNATWCINMKFDASPGALKAAMRDIFGVSEEDVTEELCLMAAGDTQPLAGLYVEFDNKIIKTMDVVISAKFPNVSLTDKGAGG